MEVCVEELPGAVIAADVGVQVGEGEPARELVRLFRRREFADGQHRRRIRMFTEDVKPAIATLATLEK